MSAQLEPKEQSLSPYCTPHSRDEITNQLLTNLETEAINDKILTPHSQAIRAAAETVLGHLPSDIKTSKQACITLRHAAGKVDRIAEAQEKLQKTSGLENTDLENLYKKLRTAFSFIMYGEYIEQYIAEILIPYCASHKPPERWGIGSFNFLEKNGLLSGKAFYMFWIKQIERNKQTFFREKILPRLSEAWQKNFLPHKLHEFCPYAWGTMQLHEIAEVLKKLKRKTDPSRQRWGLGSLAAWTGDHGEAWGSSLLSYWRSHIEDKGGECFAATILPHLPDDWATNYETKIYIPCPDWKNMADNKIADTLAQYLPQIQKKRWALQSHSLHNMIRRFLDYWKTNVEKLPNDEQFRLRILPHLPPHLRNTYRRNGHIITLRQPSPEDKTAADSAEDPDILFTMAENGNSCAFEKLLGILEQYAQNRFPNLEIPREILSRIIHTHLPNLNNIIPHAAATIKKGEMQYVQHTEKPIESLRSARNIIRDIEIHDTLSRIFDFMKEQGVSESGIVSFLDAMIAEDFDMLAVEVKYDEPEIKKAVAYALELRHIHHELDLDSLAL